MLSKKLLCLKKYTGKRQSKLIILFKNIFFFDLSEGIPMEGVCYLGTLGDGRGRLGWVGRGSMGEGV